MTNRLNLEQHLLELFFLEARAIEVPEILSKEDWNRRNHLKAYVHHIYHIEYLKTNGRINYNQFRRYLECGVI